MGRASIGAFFFTRRQIHQYKFKGCAKIIKNKRSGLKIKTAKCGRYCTPQGLGWNIKKSRYLTPYYFSSK